MFRGREIGCYNERIALKLDMHLDSAWESLNVKIAASRLTRSCGKTSDHLVNRGPGTGGIEFLIGPASFLLADFRVTRLLWEESVSHRWIKHYGSLIILMLYTPFTTHKSVIGIYLLFYVIEFVRNSDWVRLLWFLKLYHARSEGASTPSHISCRLLQIIHLRD